MDYIFLKPNGEIGHFLNTSFVMDDPCVVENSLSGEYEFLTKNYIYDFSRAEFVKVQSKPGPDYEWSVAEGLWKKRELDFMPRFVMRSA